MKKFNFTATEQGKLLKIAQKNIMGYSYFMLEKALRKKDFKINKIRVKDNVQVNVGDNIEVFLEDLQKSFFSVFYEDDNIIVFNKQKGIEVCDGDFNIKNEYLNQTNKQIFPVHRIDRNTLGLVLFAKNKDMESKLTNVFKNHYVYKKYYAIVSGYVGNKEVKLEGYLVKNKQTNTVKIYDTEEKNSSFIQTIYKQKQKLDEKLYLLDVKIVAGKTHQIRAHLAYNNLPILGDEKYGDAKINKQYHKKTQQLLAYQIVFKIPKSNKLCYLNDLNLQIENTLSL